MRSIEVPKADNGVQFATTGGGGASSSRWPKVEVEALIRLRTDLEAKYQENGPKGPLWEDISTAMRRLGYERSAKRCKEKWENINKYFKKVKESNKKRREDSKTCPYFQQLDEIYREKTSKSGDHHGSSTLFTCTTQFSPMISAAAPLMVTPEQQWPPLQQQQQQQQGWMRWRGTTLAKTMKTMTRTTRTTTAIWIRRRMKMETMTVASLRSWRANHLQWAQPSETWITCPVQARIYGAHTTSSSLLMRVGSQDSVGSIKRVRSRPV
ncbi:hypothetical protein NL676_026362 [Syzygium grande]|nr:hypothetical protein NL676_026362 [Syzygium grande]